MQPSAGSLTGRPPDTVVQSMQPSAGSLTGRPPDTVVQSMQPSAGPLDNWTTSQHRPSRHAAFGEILNRMTSRHRRSRCTLAVLQILSRSMRDQKNSFSSIYFLPQAASRSNRFRNTIPQIWQKRIFLTKKRSFLIHEGRNRERIFLIPKKEVFWCVIHFGAQVWKRKQGFAYCTYVIFSYVDVDHVEDDIQDAFCGISVNPKKPL